MLNESILEKRGPAQIPQFNALEVEFHCVIDIG
jgi:hypothetical protein